VFRLYHPLLAFIAILSGLFTQASSPASLAGTVVNKVTGAPVRHAHVMYIKIASGAADSQSPLSGDTDGDGRFAFQLEPGSYRLWVERAGFARQAYGSRTPAGPGTVLTLEPGQQIRDLTLKMVPLGAIAGRVFDEEDDPLQGVAIQVLRFSYGSGRRQLVPVAGASSNDRGEYRVYNLPAGRYYLLATRGGSPLSHPPETGVLIPDTQEHFASLYYPGVLDLASASMIALPEGSELPEIDLHLSKVSTVRIRGRLLSPVADFAGSQLQVVLAYNDNNFASYINRASAVVDPATGRFELRAVPPGSYLLVASQLYRGHALGGRTAIEVSSSAPQEAVTVALTSGFDVAGNVQMEGSTPGGTQNLSIQLQPSEGLVLGPQPSSKVAAGGNMRLSGVTPGIWDLSVDPIPEGTWIKSMTLGNMDLLQSELSVSTSAPGQLHVVLAGNGGQVSGRLVGEDQPHQATVVLVPAASDLRQLPQLYRVTSSQTNGAFTFKGVRPGRYKLFAFEDVEPFAWLDPDFLKPVESLGEPISVEEGSRIARQLTLISPEALIPGR
jgi:hypothetical protein